MSFDFGDLAGIGVGAATGNWVGAAVSAVGLGMSIFGGNEQADIAKQQAGVSRDIASQEQGINAEKQKAMEISGRRQQLEVYRNEQRLRAQATNAAVNQGAFLGSGLQGGLAQITDQTIFNGAGINSGLETGRAIAGYNNKISGDKMQLASLGGDAASAAGLTSLGGAVMKAGPVVGQLSAGFGKPKASGDFSGNPWSQNTGNLY